MFERSGAPFVSVDSATINDSMAESTLFGHERGAFTGADRARCGLFEEADGGLLFFDEIGNMPLSIQNKLLRVLQEQEVRRLGCNKVRRANVRVIAATNADLREAVKQGTFRFDLYARLSVFEIHIPSLRDRRTDILPLIWHISSSYCGDFDISEEALRVFFDYDWPGNVRELSHTLQFALAMAGGKRIEKEMLPPKMLTRRFGETPRADSASLAERMGAYERVILHETFTETKGNISAMARILKTDRASLYRKLRRHHLADGQHERVTARQ